MRSFLPVLCLLVACLATGRAQTPPLISVHDPVMIRQDSTYYVFATGRGLRLWSSPDRQHWKAEKPVFDTPPAWTLQANPATRPNDLWAPDISYHNGLYYLYYSSSVFGKNSSAIGLATNTTLHPADPNYHWADRGLVIQSVPGQDNWNAIDPNLFVDDEKQGWLTFGSFWSGIQLVRLNDSLTAPAANANLHTIASRPRTDSTGVRNAGNGAIEAPFLFKHNGYHYLFVSVDYCCRGVNSTYKIWVGRSKKITGPYLDQSGKQMKQGGGTPVLQGDANWQGVGHNAVYTVNNADYLIYHGYDAADKGKSKLLIRELRWDKTGWPVVP
ncbi:arabinan endo-1,5-alpha-L-arabinosidase [Spirosoma rhododendri]|uniref:Arabinan endo-1,5-alpha-L-arabinosidase n=1 Tax=Spirosoma rhododendri TaxID=2728024 RepID=A0A7L5DQP3_9BACT|nr:arabinan endo-1,5-alpha-L-arabinosidase [Spirosoma rhododendri]QJD80794.1 arabinan endo-1,5-alpha-L-arabinosidase [Spirosoma rhododendri]